MDPKYLYNENVERMQPIGVEFNMGYILAATAIAGLVIAYLVYWLLSTTKSAVPADFVASSSSQSATMSRSRHATHVRPTLRTGPISDDDTDEDSDEARERLAEETKNKKKIGVKKAAKLEMKAEKRAAREVMLQEREEKKREQEYLDMLRKEEEEKERKEEEERLEQERLAEEERKKKEHEQYLELAQTFDVQEEGYDPEDNTEDKLKQFIDYIHEQKVVLLENLAAHFKMRTKDVVDRIQNLISTGSLVGIIDDRGKFISITTDELNSVSKFIRQRGRVTVDELVVNSNKLINLKPGVKA